MSSNPYFLRACRCTRCTQPLPPGDIPSIPRIGRKPRSSHASVPVCEGCLRDRERRSLIVCEGCGERKFIYPATRTTCSSACWQRARRARIRCERPPLKCDVCATFFFPKRRADAKYCSNLCRQLAYRERSGLKPQ
jgi:hypothetical protein